MWNEVTKARRFADEEAQARRLRQRIILKDSFFLVAPITYLVTRNVEFNFDYILNGGVLDKISIIGTVLWLLLENIVGAIIVKLVIILFIFIKLALYMTLVSHL